MRSIIIEDENHSLEHLYQLVQQNFQDIEVVAKLRSVEDSIEWLKQNPDPDLIFIDIELSDGTCFEILDEIPTKAKLLFTTAYDQHAIRAFEYNSIAYLLKPITKEKLIDAVSKIENFYISNTNQTLVNEIKQYLKADFKKRFLVKKGDKFWHVPVNDISIFASEDGLTLAYLFDKRRFFIDHSLDELEQLLDPSLFFRVNRKLLINIRGIVTVKTYFTRRLLLETQPAYSEPVIVSKERVSNFKAWLNE